MGKMVEDIEDLVLNVDNRHLSKSDKTKDEKTNIDNFDSWDKLIVNSEKKDPFHIENSLKRGQVDESINSFLPGKATVHLRTWGCTHNTSDGEYMAGLLSSSGYTMVEDADQADVWLLNSCTVKSPSEDRFRNAISEGKSSNKVVVVAGCVPQGRPGAEYLDDVNVVGVNNVDRVVEVVEGALQGTKVRLLGAGRGKKSTLSMPKVRRNALIEIVAINSGCLNRCTYCKTKHARGNLRSHPIEDIVERVKECIAEGVVEIWLTSEDTGAYGRDIDVSLPMLLEAVLKELPSHVRLRLGMTNPPYIMDHLSEISELMRHPQIYRFLHVPMQSGSDAVLRDMRREYNRDEFCRLVDKLSSEVQGIHIATDVICGFPTETDEDFEQTMELCRRYRFASLFINQFYPRPGTAAAKMRRVCTTQEVKRRTKKLSEFFHSYSKLTEDRIGEVCQVLVTDFSHDKRFLVGHTLCYEQVLLEKDMTLMGKMVDVRVTEVSKFFMRAEIVDKKRKIGLSESFKMDLWMKIAFLMALISLLFSWVPFVAASTNLL